MPVSIQIHFYWKRVMLSVYVHVTEIINYIKCFSSFEAGNCVNKSGFKWKETINENYLVGHRLALHRIVICTATRTIFIIIHALKCRANVTLK